jgi:DNA-binding MarR family transcriptional regulator
MQERNCGELIKHIHCAMQKNANNELRAEDLTFAQVHLLFILQHQPEGTCPLKGLEKKLGIAQSTTAGLVKRSAEKGFVELLDDPTDRRVKLAHITEKGLKVCDDTVEKIRCSEERMVRLLTPEEADTLVALLGKVYQAVSQPD